MNWIKRRYREIIAVCCGVVVSLLLLELLLRVCPTKYTDFGSQRIPYISRQNGLYKLLPNCRGNYFTVDYRLRNIRSNAYGYRDRNVVSRNYTVAVLGDSFMEAVQIPEGEYTARQLEGLLQTNVLNAAVSGYGTLQAYLTYTDYVKKYRPKVVLLYFLTNNDLIDNSLALKQKTYEPHLLPAATYGPEGLQIVTAHIDEQQATRKTLRAYMLGKLSKIYFIGYRLWERRGYSRQNVLARLTRQAQDLPPAWNVYLPPRDRDWQEAWRITEALLIKLNAEVVRNGGTLVIVTVPEYIRVADDWKALVSRETGLSTIPEGFDPYEPVRHLQKITVKSGIRFLSLEPSFVAYKKQHQLPEPLFYYRHDGHWNPLGHYLAAHTTAAYLVENKLIAVPGRPQLLRTIRANLALSPEQILGAQALKQLYNKSGIYTGNSNIIKILKKD